MVGLFWFIKIPELERSIRNISPVIQDTWKVTVAAIVAQQKSSDSLVQVVLQNRRALDVFTAEAGAQCHTS